MRRFELRLGGHLTTGIVELYNTLMRLYSSIEAAIVPDIAAGVCLLRKSSVGEACIVPEPLDAEAALTVMASAHIGCIPNSALIKGAGLILSGAASSGVVPDVSGAVQLGYPSKGDSAVEILVQPVQTDVLPMLGKVHCAVEAELQSAEAELKKWADIQFAVLPGCDACAALQKVSEGENCIAVATEAAAFLGRYRKLYELDDSSLAGMDEMTLGDLDFIIVDS